MNEVSKPHSGVDAIRKVIACMDGSEFEADGFPTMDDAKLAGEQLDRLEEQLEAAHRENKALYAEIARLPNRQAAEAFGRVRVAKE